VNIAIIVIIIVIIIVVVVVVKRRRGKNEKEVRIWIYSIEFIVYFCEFYSLVHFIDDK
jgi:hypothetical protein